MKLLKITAIVFQWLVFLVLEIGADNLIAGDLPIGIQEKLNTADTYFSNSKYHEAIQAYMKLVEKISNAPAVYLRIADSYLLTGQPDSAYVWYTKYLAVEKFPGAKHEFYYAKTLNAMGKYPEAGIWFEKYAVSIGNTTKSKMLIEGLGNISMNFVDSAYIKVENLGINSKWSEFSPGIYGTALVFASDRNKKTSKMASTPFDLYISKPAGDGSFEPPQLFSKTINSVYNEGQITFFENNTSAIYTSNNSGQPAAGAKQNTLLLGLFNSVKEGNKWLNISPLPFNSQNYSVGHPSVNSAGNILFFVSNMPGGQGGTDIYKSELINGNWARPQNLGPEINTEMDELFPFVSGNKLYFTSNGHSGLGGLDIYCTNLSDKGLKVTNLGYPINTRYDDFGLTLNSGQTSGFFASNRPGGKGGDDIYSYRSVKINMSVQVFDKATQAPVNGALIKITDQFGSAQTYFTGTDGKYSFIGIEGVEYKIIAGKGDEMHDVYTIVQSSAQDTAVYLYLSKIEPVIAQVDITQPEKNIAILPSTNANIIYKVQIGACKKRLSMKDLKKRGYNGGSKNVEHYYEDEWHKYAIGAFNSLTKAVELQQNCKVFDAFIIGYQNGKKLEYHDVVTALKMLGQQGPNK